MRFYIATGLVNAEHARKAAEVLRRNGHEQTYDWTTHGDIRHEGARAHEPKLLSTNCAPSATPSLSLPFFPAGKAHIPNLALLSQHAATSA